MNYDLVQLFGHPLRFRRFIPPAIVVFGGTRDTGPCEIAVAWKPTASGTTTNTTLTLSWDVATLRPRLSEIDEELQILRTRDEDQATHVEEAAVVVAVAVMAHIEPSTLFTCRSATGTRHDYEMFFTISSVAVPTRGAAGGESAQTSSIRLTRPAMARTRTAWPLRPCRFT